MLGGIRALLVALGDNDPTVRTAALFAITEIGPEARRALPRIRRMLDDPDEGVRKFAKDAAARIEGLGPR